MATRNAMILKVLNEMTKGKEVTVENLDSLKDIFNEQLDPAIADNAVVITNQSGFNYLDKLKDKDGNYILQKDPTQQTKGQFFGYNDTTHEVKVFYIEKWWGNRWDRINGLLMVGGEILAKMTPPYNLTGKDFEKVGITFASSGNGYQKGTKSSRFGRIVNSIGGSSSTYTCDYFWWNAGITAVALVGGICDNGEACGADYLNLNSSAGVANWNIGASVFLEQPIAA